MIKIEGLRKFTDADKNLFAKSEIEMLELVAKRFGDDSTDQVVDTSHKEAPWKETEYGQVIPYELAAHDADSLFAEDEIRLLQEMAI